MKKTPKHIQKQQKKILNKINNYYKEPYIENKSKSLDDCFNSTEYKNLEKKLSEIESKFNFYKDLDNYIATDKITEILLDIKNIEYYDAYGSGLYKYKDIEFYLFDNYGDSDIDRIPFRIFTPFIMYKDFSIEIGDIVYDLESKQFVLKNIAKGSFPKVLQKFGINTFCGKRTYYYEPKKNLIEMRCCKDLYDSNKIPKKYKIPKSYKNDLSGTKIRFSVKLEK